MFTRSLLAASLLTCVAAHAEDDAQKRAREELERQLQQMVGAPQPARVRVDFEALDEPNYKLEAASFEVDSQPLSAPSVEELGREGAHAIWSGEVKPGKHVVVVHLTYASQASVVVSDEGGYAWKLVGSVSFDVPAGIEVRVKVTPLRDGTQKDISKRILVRLPATPVMLAKLDDGKMPEPVAPPAPVDAGVPVTPEQLAAEEKKRKAEEAAEAKRAAAEAKKQKAAEAAEAKRAAAEEKKRKAAEAAEERKRKLAEAAEARRTAAEEKKRKAAEAAEAKRAAAEEKKRLAEEARQAARAGKDAGVAVAASEVDAGVAEVAQADEVDAGEVEDAGAPAQVAEVMDAGMPAPAAPPAEAQGEGEGGLSPLLVAAGAGVVVVLGLLLWLARRRASPPKLDD